MKGTDATAPWLLRVGWTRVFWANLPLPLLLGFLSTDWGGRIGMFAAIGPLYLLGRESCRSVHGLDSVMIWGGMLVAITQVFPIVHVFAGFFALRSAWRLGFTANEMGGAVGALSGCFVTLLTGGTLLAIAAVAGLSCPIAKMMLNTHHPHHPTTSAGALDDLA